MRRALPLLGFDCVLCSGTVVLGALWFPWKCGWVSRPRAPEVCVGGCLLDGASNGWFRPLVGGRLG